ncbi:hypothetical protein F2Q69_00042750 [Brassica cretica]|uniref:Uncharacterized protein n=1 Tax=Brassica cretica TaxID=69181 RepID=A0A8S9ND05_BRACR|nr:hypothetical protein F2Q69_00042750 [Brassica cretica]
MALRPNTLMDVDIDFFALGHESRLSQAYGLHLLFVLTTKLCGSWSYSSRKLFCYAGSLRDLIVGLQPDG